MIPQKRSVCVYCGARDGANPAYCEAAREVGALLAAEGWQLVYGAGDVGVMGAVARAATEAGADAMGVIPAHLLAREKGRRDLSRFIVTETMHERKKVMFMNADAVVVLPGGAGTLDEFFEALTWRQLGLHDKPVFLLNVGGYWTPLLAVIERMIAEGFAEHSLRAMVSVAETVPDLGRGLRAALK